ncbi:unnamed protein product [Danaus chrysippus]|uniref:(African queen) hypothetical protein n=1 Tax=Danaus chrysippus TaxID=151541 RepID=A0A8J2VV80_9NEOP|nr:unnamed protein product [Danaus chrysippus]
MSQSRGSSVDCVAESKLELLVARGNEHGRDMARCWRRLVREVRRDGGRGGGGSGGAPAVERVDATRPVCTTPLPHSLMQKRAKTSGEGQLLVTQSPHSSDKNNNPDNIKENVYRENPNLTGQ